MRTPRPARDKFNYAKFYSDLNNACVAKKTTVSSLSANKFYRSKGYLDKYLAHATLPVNILSELAAFMGANLKDYEMKKPESVKPESVKAEPVKAKPDKGWNMEVKVDTEYGVAMVKITKDGEKVCTGQRRCPYADIQEYI